MKNSAELQTAMQCAFSPLTLAAASNANMQLDNTCPQGKTVGNTVLGLDNNQSHALGLSLRVASLQQLGACVTMDIVCCDC